MPVPSSDACGSGTTAPRLSAMVPSRRYCAGSGHGGGADPGASDFVNVSRDDLVSLLEALCKQVEALLREMEAMAAAALPRRTLAQVWTRKLKTVTEDVHASAGVTAAGVHVAKQRHMFDPQVQALDVRLAGLLAQSGRGWAFGAATHRGWVTTDDCLEQLPTGPLFAADQDVRRYGRGSGSGTGSSAREEDEHDPQGEAEDEAEPSAVAGDDVYTEIDIDGIKPRGGRRQGRRGPGGDVNHAAQGGSRDGDGNGQGDGQGDGDGDGDGPAR